ncbi:MAG: UPF0175 family protein [Leptospiraceae bacterium]|nr:UPF0175 family protein [Leptospiraceae bacterium]MCP5495911.1 UPF0175 family protein [Leptospiraceae bacterium]
MDTLKVDFPSFLALSLKLDEVEFVFEIKKMALIKLYELGKVSSSVGAKILGIHRIDFIEMLAKYKVSCFDELTETELQRQISAI